MIRITDHACQRFRERVANVSDDDARTFLANAVTILPSDMPAGRLDPRRDENYRMWY